MDSLLRIRSNAIYKKSSSKKYSRGRKNTPSPYIFDKIKEIQLNLPDYHFNGKMCGRRGLFLRNKKYGIVIVLNDKTVKQDNTFLSKCKNKRYLVFYYDINSNNIEELLTQINNRMVNLSGWIKDKAEELNNELPKSEVWFQNKFKKESFYDLLEVEYNKPYKRFIYDVFCLKYNLVIEIDGSVHGGKNQQRDDEKNKMTGMYGLKILHIKAYDNTSYDGCIKKIKDILNGPRCKKPVDNHVSKSPMPNVILRKSS